MGIHSVVVVREVWDTRDLVGDVLTDAGDVLAEQFGTRFEPQDLNALEAALRLKDDQGGTVTAVSIGAAGGVDVLRECLYRGTDQALRVDADPRSLDSATAAALLAAAIRTIEPADLIFCGVTVVEGESSLLGAHLAVALGMERVSFLDGVDSVADGKVVAKRAIEMGYEYVEAEMPALLSIGVALTEDDPRTPRSAKAMLKLKAKKVEIPVLSPAELGVDLNPLVQVAGRTGVPERVVESREVDPEDESALKSMLDTVVKGDG